jgi:PAS domain-containing protein
MYFAITHKRYIFTLKKMGSLLNLTKTLNRNQDFLDFREKSLALILSICTFGGATVIIVWHVFDYYSFHEIGKSLGLLRTAVILVFIANWLLARRNLLKIGFRNHLYIGLYLGAIFCIILNMMTGGALSPNWPGLLFILIAFMIMPFPYHKIILHSLIILILNAIVIFSYSGFEWLKFFQINFLYTGVFVISCLISFIHNEKDARAFIQSKASDEALQRESEINNKLRAEIDLRKQIEQTLDNNRQYLQNILNNAPIIAWAVDINGKILLLEGKG